MIDKTASLLRGWRKRVAGLDGSSLRILRKKEKRPRGKPEFRVVYETFEHTSSAMSTVLKRKRASQDLREESKRSSDLVDESPSPGCPAQGDEREEIDGAADVDEAGNVDKADQTSEQFHTLGCPPHEDDRLVRQYVAVPRIPRTKQQLRPSGLFIDVNATADPDELDTAVSPTNTDRQFQTRSPLPVGADGYGVGFNDLQGARRLVLSHRRSTLAGSFVESQERFDGYVDAISDERAKRHSQHAVLSTDIARLAAELDVLQNRITMVNIRTAHHRQSMLGATSARPESWATGSTPISHICSCGQRFELRPEQGQVKRQTWYGGQPPPARSRSKSRSRKSETKQEVMLRNSAGTNLFRQSLYEGQEESGRSLTQKPETPVPQVELRKSFDFRMECERIAGGGLGRLLRVCGPECPMPWSSYE